MASFTIGGYCDGYCGGGGQGTIEGYESITDYVDSMMGGSYDSSNTATVYFTGTLCKGATSGTLLYQESSRTNLVRGSNCSANQLGDLDGFGGCSAGEIFVVDSVSGYSLPGSYSYYILQVHTTNSRVLGLYGVSVDDEMGEETASSNLLSDCGGGASPSPTATVTPSVTPSVTASVTPSVSITPSISITPSVTPSVSITPSISITPSVTPSVSITPSISITPSVTPSVTPSISVSPSVTPSVSSLFFIKSSSFIKF